MRRSVDRLTRPDQLLPDRNEENRHREPHTVILNLRATRWTRRVRSAAALAALATVLTACGLDAPDETSRERTVAQAANFSVGGVQVRSVFLTYGDASGSDSGGSSDSTDVAASPSPGLAPPAYLVTTIVNDGSSADQLTGVTGSFGTATVSGGGASAGVDLPPGVPVAFGAPSSASTGPTLTFESAGSATPAKLGTTVPLTFHFATAGDSATIQVPVVSTEYVTTEPTRDVPSGPPATNPAGGNG